MAVVAPHDLLHFVEVLQFEWPHYDVWYQALDLGLPITPTAGTDFPCGPWSVPGRERFYTRVEGELDRFSVRELAQQLVDENLRAVRTWCEGR